MLINIILIFVCIYFVAKIMNSVAAVAEKEKSQFTVKSTCPPHSWSWVPVYNENGGVHHEHIVCAKCGPLRGVREND